MGICILHLSIYNDQMDTQDTMSNLGATDDHIHLILKDEDVLYKAYMPFIKDGGLFIKSNKQNPKIGDELKLKIDLLNKEDTIYITGKIVWIAPKDLHSQFTEGVGVQLLGPEAREIRKIIEAAISTKIGSNQKTDTL